MAHCRILNFSQKKVDPSCMSGKTSSWESLRKMILNIQKDYKLKYQQYRLSGNHSNTFINFCHGRLDTYYLHIWLNKRDPNLLESIVEEHPDEVKFESNNLDNSIGDSSVSIGQSKQKKRKSAADISERHLQMKMLVNNNKENIVSVDERFSTKCTDVSKTKRETDVPKLATDKLIEDQKVYELEREGERDKGCMYLSKNYMKRIKCKRTKEVMSSDVII